MAISSKYAEALVAGVKPALTMALQKDGGEADFVSDLCFMTNSDGASENYPAVGMPPQMVNVTSAEIPQFDLSIGNLQIVNQEFAAILTVLETDFEDDRSGGIQAAINAMVPVAQNHRKALVISTLVAGTTTTGYDGSALYSDTHADKSSPYVAVGTQDNLLAGTGITTDKVETDLNTGITTLMGFRSDNGEYFGAESASASYVIVAPPALRKPFLEALNSTQTTTQVTNVQVDGLSFKLVLSPRLTDATDWYLARVDTGKPLAFQMRSGLRTEFLGQGTVQGTLQRCFHWKVRARYACAPWMWPTTVKFVNS